MKPSSVTSEVIRRDREGRDIRVFTLTNQSGAEARIVNYGGIVLSLKMPDRNGVLGDVVLGYEQFDEYFENGPYFGALIGRFANRIAGGHFVLDGKRYDLAVNNGRNALHGGLKGFDKVLWTATSKVTAGGPALGLNYVSPDGEEGYPGTLSVTAVYTLTEDNALTLEFTAVTDQDTVVNLTHHSYFNLAGQGDVLDHELKIESDSMLPIDAHQIPVGTLLPVEASPFDFRTPHAMGARIHADHPQLAFGNGYDHAWVLNKPAGELGLAATVYEPTSGRVMEVLTTEPTIQFYSGNFLNVPVAGKAGCQYQPRHGFCIEPQHCPDAPNKPMFASTVLKPGQLYRNTIEYRFRSDRSLSHA